MSNFYQNGRETLIPTRNFGGGAGAKISKNRKHFYDINKVPKDDSPLQVSLSKIDII